MAYKALLFLRIIISSGIQKIDLRIPNSTRLISLLFLLLWNNVHHKILKIRSFCYIKIIWEGVQKLIPAELNFLYQFRRPNSFTSPWKILRIVMRVVGKVGWCEPFSIAFILQSKHASVPNFVKISQKWLVGWTKKKYMNARIDKLRSIQKIRINWALKPFWSSASNL